MALLQVRAGMRFLDFGTAARTWSFWPRSSENEAVAFEEVRAGMGASLFPVLSDIELDVQSETAERSRARG